MIQTPAAIKNKLTKWEAGNELVKATDAIHEAIADLRDYEDKDLIKALQKARNAIRKVWKEKNFDNEMGFGI